MLEDELGQRVIERELLQHILIGAGLARGGLLEDGQLLAVEQDLADLLRAAKVEGLTRRRVGALFNRRHAASEFIGLGQQQRRVDPNADALHLEQHLRQWQLDVAVDAGKAGVALDLRRQMGMDLQGEIGVLSGVLGSRVQIDLIEANLRRALAADRLVADGFGVEMSARQCLEVVAQVAFQHVRLQ